MEYGDEFWEFIDFRKTHPRTTSGSYFNLMKEKVLDYTKFLDKCCTLGERLYYIENELYDQVKCPTCNKKTRFNVKLQKPKFCSIKCKCNFKINGETTSKINARKMHITKSKIDIKSGLTLYEIAGQKTKESRSKINLETGLTGYQSDSIKSNITKSKIDPETGLCILDSMNKKRLVTMNQLDPKSGLKLSQLSSRKGIRTQNETVDSNGISIFQHRVNACNITKSKIDNGTGKSSHTITAERAANTMSKIDLNTGLRIYDTISLKNKTKSYLKIVEYFNESKSYTLLTSLEEYVGLTDYRTINFKCDNCQTEYIKLYPSIRCTKCYPYNKSIGENEVLEFCQSLTSKAISNSRSIIPPLELDIYIPNHNLAIEYNGLFWHSSYSVETEKPNYHLNKTELCNSRGIQLFHIFENEWQDDKKQEIWKSIIRNKLGKSQRIFARKTKVTKITSKDTKEFLNSNHLQGACVSSVNLGLVFDNELVAVMVFRELKNRTWELLRYCSKLGTEIDYGFLKLLEEFTNTNNSDIIVHINKRWNSSKIYELNGFTFKHETIPNYLWYKDNMIHQSIDVGYNHGYRKIYDCGNQVWELII